MRVSVVVTTVDDDSGKLDLAVQGWLRVLNKYPDTELIVVNDGGPNGVPDQVQNWLRYGCIGQPAVPLRSRFLYLDPPSDEFRLAAARNLGIQHARGSRVVFTDSDCIPGPDLPLHHNITTKDVIAIGFRNRIRNNIYREWKLLPNWEVVRNAHWRKDERFDEPHPVGWRGCEHVWGCNFSVDRDLLLACGGFDSSIIGWGGEDINLADRLMRHAGAQLIVTNSVVFHLDHPPRAQRSPHPFGARNRPLIANGGPLRSVA